jgi:hypothetical protein
VKTTPSHETDFAQSKGVSSEVRSTLPRPTSGKPTETTDFATPTLSNVEQNLISMEAPMRLSLPLATILYSVCLPFPTLSCAQTIIKLTTASLGYLIVPVSVNGSGPYPFLLDTGSNRTF